MNSSDVARINDVITPNLLLIRFLQVKYTIKENRKPNNATGNLAVNSFTFPPHSAKRQTFLPEI